MRFDTSQHMKLSQQMKLAPRMIQSMEILQMPLLALRERIEQELESNIAFETFEPGGDPEQLEQQRQEAERDAREGERELNVQDNGGVEDFARLDNYQAENPEAVENEYSATSNGDSGVYEYTPSTYSASRMGGERDAKMDAMANTAAREGSLGDQLLEQWTFADVDDDVRDAGKLLIEHIDDDGYVRTDLDKVIADTPRNGQVFTRELLETALAELQRFLEPAGIGARDVRECLLIQLDVLAETDPLPDDQIVRTLIADHLDDLIHNRIPKIAGATGLTLDEIKTAMEHMRRLSIHPGRQLVNDSPPTIVPDAIIEYDEDLEDYIVYLTEGRLPNLRLNREYARLSRDRAVAKQDRDFIRTNLNNAQWLIDAVHQRRQTLLRVLRAVVAAQRDVFDYGMESVKPLPMTQVADQLGVHVATVSRAVAGKYVQTPRGIVPLRKFFIGGTQTDSGEDVSWDAIKAAMKEVVDAEDKSHPLSDEAIVKGLKDKGIDIARRTVAKYRSQLDIPPARMRKQY